MGYKNTRKSYAIDPVKNSGPYEAIVRNVLDPGYAGSIQVEILTREKQSFLKEKESINEKLEHLSELESVNKNNENDRIQVREKVIHLLEKLEKFDLT